MSVKDESRRMFEARCGIYDIHGVKFMDQIAEKTTKLRNNVEGDLLADLYVDRLTWVADQELLQVTFGLLE